MHRNINRSSKCEQKSEVFCRNPNNFVFLCKTRSLTIRVIKSMFFGSMLNWFRSSANYWMRALPNFSLSTLGQLAGPPAIRWPDCCLSGWPVSTSRATVLHFPKTSDNTVVHPRHDNTFCIDDFDFSFLIQGAGRHDFQWRPLLH